MADCTFLKGNPINIDYTPTGGDVALGKVVVIGTVTANTGGAGALACIAPHAITNNIQGVLDAGGGTYSFLNLNNAANGAKVYWDGTSKATTASTNNAVLGTIVKNGAGGANSACWVLHQPAYGGN
jgi:hypothetical protein